MKAESVSMKTFGEMYVKVAADKGTLKDLAEACKMNPGAVNGKLVQLRKIFKDKGKVLPALTRSARTANGKKSVGDETFDLMQSLFSETPKNEKTDESGSLSEIGHHIVEVADKAITEIANLKGEAEKLTTTHA